MYDDGEIDFELTTEEEKAIKSLKRLAKKWPKSLWLYSASGNLCVMRRGENGDTVFAKNDGIDQNYVVDTIYGIPNSGGDW